MQTNLNILAGKPARSYEIGIMTIILIKSILHVLNHLYTFYMSALCQSQYLFLLSMWMQTRCWIFCNDVYWKMWSRTCAKTFVWNHGKSPKLCNFKDFQKLALSLKSMKWCFLHALKSLCKGLLKAKKYKGRMVKVCFKIS